MAGPGSKTVDSACELHAGWRVAEVPSGAGPAEVAALPDAAWLAARVPGSAHGALLAAGRIPDPFFGLNEAGVQWVGERSWAWQLRFEVAEGPLAPHEDLVFEGLDTWCSVWLNGEPLLEADNMFVPRRVDVRSRLRAGTNELLLRFDPPLARAREREARFGRGALWNGDSARLHARKAQYHFGWDWGPVLLTSGPWRPVRRQRYAVRIDGVHCRTQIGTGTWPRATLTVHTRLAGAADGLRIEHELLDADGRCVASAHAAAADGQPRQLVVEAARLWWPRGLGGQPLYRLHTRVLGDDGQVLAEDRRRIGLRTLRLVQAPVEGEAGSSFCFEVNGREFFAGGANWIPEHSLLERATPERYRERVAQAAAGHMNMLRVWGGGIYEHEAFYEACDELGLLVWQDFMFACGLYPANDGFQASVEAEARAALQRLRHHASLALWCGNNEDYALAESVGAHGAGVAPERFPARAIYEQLLPALCAELDPDRPYWPGSPWSPDAPGAAVRPSSDRTVGDRHSWEVWHQQMLPYQRYGEAQGRFVSEFGMQAHPSLELLEATLPEAERFPQSRTLAWHNKAGPSGEPDGHRRLAVYLADNLRVGPSLAEHVYATQFVQAEALRVAYQDFRRRWQRPGARAVGGALVWQLNDCWPATSWAIIDFAGRCKPAWFAVRRALAPLALALRLAPGTATLAVMNGGPARAMELVLRLLALDGRCLHVVRLDRLAAADTSAEETLALPAFDEPVVGELRAFDAEGAELARDCAWPEPFRFHRFAPQRPRFRVDGAVLQVEADVPVKGLWLDAAGTGFEDNFIDLMPQAPRRLVLQGAPLRALRWTALDHAPALAEPAGTDPGTLQRSVG